MAPRHQPWPLGIRPPQPVAFGYHPPDCEPYFKFYPENGSDEAQIKKAIAEGHPGVRIRFDNGMLCVFKPLTPDQYWRRHLHPLDANPRQGRVE